MSAPAPIDVLALGATAVDDVLTVDRHPRPGEKIPVHARRRFAGGQAATALVAVARLGGTAAYGGALASEGLGAFVRQRLRAEGVELFGEPVTGAGPVHATVIVDATGNRTILYDLAGATGAGVSGPDPAWLDRCGVLLIDQLGVEGMARAAEMARSRGVPVVADLEHAEETSAARLLALTDHCLVNRAFARAFTGHDDTRAAVWSLAEAAGSRTVVVTDGARGCWYAAGPAEPVHHEPALDVAAVDTTGCGDVFHGAYAWALARGYGLAERVRLASATAALSGRHEGAQPGIPDRAAVKRFASAAPLD